MAQHRWVMLALISGIVAGVTAATRAALGRTHDGAVAAAQPDGEDQITAVRTMGSASDPTATTTDPHGDGAAEMAREWEQGVAPSDS